MSHSSDSAAPNAFPTPTRRRFLAALSTAAAGGAMASLSEPVNSQEKQPLGDVKAQPPANVLDSPPVLQNPTATGATIAWAVRGPATGWVEYGETPDLGKRADSPANGLNPVSDRFMSVRLEDLTPGAKVYYRIVGAPIHYKSAYAIERGDATASEVYQFSTLNLHADSASFAVINDTHESEPVLKSLTSQLAAEPADFTVWNGDVFNDVRDDEQIVAQTLRPAGGAYASTRPVLFTSGNHDVRGKQARRLSQALTDWPDQGSLGRCFAVRQGPLALIGLDTGEDKPDRHPVFAGLANFEPYREAQAVWLKQTFARAEIAAAPFVVVFCHIPLWGRPGENPGDLLEGYAEYCRQAQRAWHPILAANKIHLLVCGHMHEFRHDAPNAERSYSQIVGGGPSLKNATLMRGRATAEKLEVTVQSLDKNVLGSWTFSPRSV